MNIVYLFNSKNTLNFTAKQGFRSSGGHSVLYRKPDSVNPENKRQNNNGRHLKQKAAQLGKLKSRRYFPKNCWAFSNSG